MEAITITTEPAEGRKGHVSAVLQAASGHGGPCMMPTRLLGLGAGLVLVGTAVLASPAGAATPGAATDHIPMVAVSPVHFAAVGHGLGAKPGRGSQTSLNWAGYAVTGPTFSNVAGGWAQPAAVCPGTKVEQAAFWVGLDGYSKSDPTVEQIGTDSDCTKGKGKKPGGPSYYAWYQMYPQSVVVLPTTSYPVAPGDAITSGVSLSGSTYILTISDGVKWHFSTNQTPATLPLNSSAEWIAEAPSSCTGTKCKVLPLANFGSIAFSGASANGQAIPWAGFTNYQISMTTKNGKIALAQPSALAGGGNAFTITWLKL